MVYKSDRCLRSSLSTQSDTDLSNNSSPLLADMFLEVSSLAAKSGLDILVPVSKLPEQRQGVDETTFSLLDCQHRRQQQNGIIHAKIKNLSSFLIHVSLQTHCMTYFLLLEQFKCIYRMKHFLPQQFIKNFVPLVSKPKTTMARTNPLLCLSRCKTNPTSLDWNIFYKCLRTFSQ